MNFKYLSGILARWMEELSQYDMVVLHRKGVDHTNADALSRIPTASLSAIATPQGAT